MTYFFEALVAVHSHDQQVGEVFIGRNQYRGPSSLSPGTSGTKRWGLYNSNRTWWAVLGRACVFLRVASATSLAACFSLSGLSRGFSRALGKPKFGKRGPGCGTGAARPATPYTPGPGAIGFSCAGPETPVPAPPAAIRRRVGPTSGGSLVAVVAAAPARRWRRPWATALAGARAMSGAMGAPSSGSS